MGEAPRSPTAAPVGGGHSTSGPRRVVVVGAGMVGLATAWWLQERGVEVTVLDRAHPGAGASWGNAGWLTPGLTTPLPEPSILRYGVRAVVSPASPVYVPITADGTLLRFLAGFLRNCTTRRWERAMRAYLPVNRRALEAFDALSAGGVDARTWPAAPFVAAFTNPAARRGLLGELDHLAHLGAPVEHALLTGAEARSLVPTLTDAIGGAVRIDGQRFVHPPHLVAALAAAVRDRGATIVEGAEVRSIDDDGTGVAATIAGGQVHRADAAVVASGGWIGPLLRPYGVRRPVQAGRGYSFSVAAERVPDGPVYFPAERVACTPLGDRLRVAGMMEFRRPDAPLDPRRVAAIVAAVRPLLQGVDLDRRQDEWVGSRPVTDDGLPLLGPTRSPRVFAAGGHGMWGIVLGPLSGQLLADAITTGVIPPELTPFDPLR